MASIYLIYIDFLEFEILYRFLFSHIFYDTFLQIRTII